LHLMVGHNIPSSIPGTNQMLLGTPNNNTFRVMYE
jgi:hypothetical protein